MEHLKAYILALKNMNTDFTIRIAQQSDALELMSLFQETVLHINKRDYSEAEVAGIVRKRPLPHKRHD